MCIACQISIFTDTSFRQPQPRKSDQAVPLRQAAPRPHCRNGLPCRCGAPRHHVQAPPRGGVCRLRLQTLAACLWAMHITDSLTSYSQPSSCLPSPHFLTGTPVLELTASLILSLIRMMSAPVASATPSWRPCCTPSCGTTRVDCRMEPARPSSWEMALVWARRVPMCESHSLRCSEYIYSDC